jgi:hypothetical protein
MENEPDDDVLDKVHEMHESGVGTADPNIAPDETPAIEEAEPGDDKPIVA